MATTVARWPAHSLGAVSRTATFAPTFTDNPTGTSIREAGRYGASCRTGRTPCSDDPASSDPNTVGHTQHMRTRMPHGPGATQRDDTRGTGSHASMTWQLPRGSQPAPIAAVLNASPVAPAVPTNLEHPVLLLEGRLVGVVRVAAGLVEIPSSRVPAPRSLV